MAAVQVAALACVLAVLPVVALPLPTEPRALSVAVGLSCHAHPCPR